jgi:ABC-type Na+ efflux pump permease subunit
MTCLSKKRGMYFMIKFIIIPVILIISYSILLGLMKAAGKKPPSMPDIQQDSSQEDSNN